MFTALTRSTWNGLSEDNQGCLPSSFTPKNVPVGCHTLGSFRTDVPTRIFIAELCVREKTAK